MRVKCHGMQRSALPGSIFTMVLLVMTAGAHAEPRTTLADGTTGKIEFRTYTPASQNPFLTRSYLGGPPSVVNGTLSLPHRAAPLERAGKVPAVVLAHGSGGISDERELAWAKRFTSWGIAAFVVDSYTGRGLKPPVYANSPGYTHFVAHLLDAYLALQLLGTHPRIDGSRVASWASRGAARSRSTRSSSGSAKAPSVAPRIGSRPTSRSTRTATSGIRAEGSRRRRC